MAVDLSEEKLEWARKLGAAETINPSGEERIDKRIRKLTDGRPIALLSVPLAEFQPGWHRIRMEMGRREIRAFVEALPEALGS